MRMRTTTRAMNTRPFFPPPRTFNNWKKNGLGTRLSAVVTNEGIMKLDSFYDPKLMNIIDTITTSIHLTTHSRSNLYKDLRAYRVKMIISSPWTRTVIGLLCCACGLRDKGFEALNAFGCLT